MAARRAVLKVTSGPNAGDALSLEMGTCRLIGRHLSESETSLIDRDGNRVLDATAVEILQSQLKEKAPPAGTTVPPPSEGFTASTFERGSDIIFSDDSISRAHAMVFFDGTGVGIIDLASTNGTYVNSERVSSVLLRHGDAINIGASDLNVEIQ